MATIVQPYSPWREQLLANFLGPLVGNMIQQSQQNAQNQKYNAMLGELAKAGQPQAPQVTPSLFTGIQQDNSNGWERAFRQGGDELAAFDANTAIAPQVTPSPVNPYNQADMMRNFMQLMASSRFSSLNPTEAYKMATPFLQSLQAQRMTDLKNQYANNLGNTSGFDDQINLLTRAAIEGAASDDTLRTMAGYAEHRQPHMTFAEMNAGDRIYRVAQNPATGRVTPMFSANVGVSPNTNATLAMQKYGYDLNADLERQRINELVTQGQYNRSQVNGYSGREQAMIAQMNKDYDALTARENALQEQMLNETDPKIKSDLNLQIRGIQQQREQLRNTIYSILATPQQQPQTSNTPDNNNNMSLGSRMLGNANDGKVSNNGHFWADRKTHNHGGTDFPAPAGTPIKIDSAMGNNLRVVRIDNNPNNSSGFGCHVRLEGEVNGQKFGYILAHMQEGSIKVRPGQIVNAGDLLGAVGNTGHSHGNHLHLEVHKGGLGGQKIDPEKFISTYEVQQQTQQPQSPQMIPQPSQPEQQNPQTQDNTQQNQRWQQPPESPVAWIHGQDHNDKMTVNDYEYFLREAQEGKVYGIRTREQLDKYLEKMGYIRQSREVTPEQDMRPAYQKTAPLPAMTNSPSVTPKPEQQQQNGQWFSGPMGIREFIPNNQTVSGDIRPLVTPENPEEKITRAQEHLDKLNGENNRNIDFNALWRGH